MISDDKNHKKWKNYNVLLEIYAYIAYNIKM